MNREICYRVNRSIELLAQEFIRKYFTYEDGSRAEEFYFVNQDDSSNLKYNFFVEDLYFTLDDMFTAIWYNLPRKDLMEWHDQWCDVSNKNRINLKTFISLKK